MPAEPTPPAGSALSASPAPPTGLSGALIPPPLAASRGWTVHWTVRLRDAIGTVLPLALMAGLAAGTWWLVNITPVPAGAGGGAAPPSTPDYILRDFELRRYLPDGALQGLIEGRVLRHYPADDRHEVDGLTLRSRNAAGQWIVATALRGEADGQGRWVRLNGEAVVQRDTAAGGAPLRVEGEAFEVLVEEGRIRSSTPVRLVQEGLVVHGAGLDYEDATQRLVLLPPVRAEWRPAARPTPVAAPARRERPRGVTR